MMNMERTLGGIVERFDQKDGPDLGERRAKTYGVRIRLTAPAMGQIVNIEKGPKRNAERSFLMYDSENNLKRSPAVDGGSTQPR